MMREKGQRLFYCRITVEKTRHNNQEKEKEK